MTSNPFQADAAGGAFLSLPRLAGRLTADLIVRSHQGLNPSKEYQLDLRGAPRSPVSFAQRNQEKAAQKSKRKQRVGTRHREENISPSARASDLVPRMCPLASET
jgi:hypothetical protein